MDKKRKQFFTQVAIEIYRYGFVHIFSSKAEVLKFFRDDEWEDIDVKFIYKGYLNLYLYIRSDDSISFTVTSMDEYDVLEKELNYSYCSIEDVRNALQQIVEEIQKLANNENVTFFSKDQIKRFLDQVRTTPYGLINKQGMNATFPYFTISKHFQPTFFSLVNLSIDDVDENHIELQIRDRVVCLTISKEKSHTIYMNKEQISKFVNFLHTIEKTVDELTESTDHMRSLDQSYYKMVMFVVRNLVN